MRAACSTDSPDRHVFISINFLYFNFCYLHLFDRDMLLRLETLRLGMFSSLDQKYSPSKKPKTFNFIILERNIPSEAGDNILTQKQ